MFNMSCPKPSCSQIQFNELILSNVRLMYNVTVLLCNVLNAYRCPVYLGLYLHEITHFLLLFILVRRLLQYSSNYGQDSLDLLM